MLSMIDCREDLVPVLLGRHIVHVVQQALIDDVVELLRRIELRGGRRIAADDAVDRRGARLVGAGHGLVDPQAAGLVIGIGELFDGR